MLGIAVIFNRTESIEYQKDHSLSILILYDFDSVTETAYTTPSTLLTDAIVCRYALESVAI